MARSVRIAPLAADEPLTSVRVTLSSVPEAQASTAIRALEGKRVGVVLGSDRFSAPTPKYATAPGRYGLAALNTHEPRAVRPTLTSQPDHRMSAKVGLPQGGATPNRAVAQDVAFVDRSQHAKWPLNDH